MADLSLSKLPWYGQLAVFVVISAAGAGAFYYFFEQPRQEALATRQTELTAIRARITVGLATARQLPEFRAQVDELTARLDSLKAILPDEKDVADLLRRIQTMAAQSDLTIRGFRPQAINTRTLHAEWPIGLELEGSYHNLGLFLDRVSKFPRIINVSGLVLQGQDGGTATLRVSCTATTFVLLDTPPAAAAAPAKKTPKKTPKKAPAKKS
ncbi:MAG: type 4a pilus biogenesis protein PilO [Vicinamibacterales bacterium]|nr:type 4a pilus biogenesis protein PilO [Vicinamibacterales bacterium]